MDKETTWGVIEPRKRAYSNSITDYDSAEI